MGIVIVVVKPETELKKIMVSTKGGYEMTGLLK